MSFRRRVARAWWRTLFRLSERHAFSGCRVAIFLPLSGERVDLERTCAEALELLRVTSPKHFRRVQSHAYGILVLGEQGPLGTWLGSAQLIQLSQTHLLGRETRAAQVASTIVHEATHAWLEHLGFSYETERRQRIEAICYRSEAAFVRRLPNGEGMAIEYEECAQWIVDQSPHEWSDEAFRTKDVDQLRALGTPEWLIRLVASTSRDAA